MSEDNDQSTGYVQDEFDPQDLYYRAPPFIQLGDSVNLREKFRDDFGNVYNQGSTGSCVANAATACYWYEEKSGRRKEVWGEEGPSRWFVYWLARGGYLADDHEIPGGGKSVGTNPRDAMKGISKCGVCVEGDCRFPDTKQIKQKISETNPNLDDGQLNAEVKKEVERLCAIKPSDTAFKNAAPHNDAFYYRLDPDRPDAKNKDVPEDEMTAIGNRLLTDLKTCLTEGYPVSFGYNNYLPNDGSRWDVKAGVLAVLNDPWAARGYPHHTFCEDLKPPLEGLGGHSVLAIGYDDHAGPDGKGAILCQNSWGSEWSQGGLFWMPYPWITDFAASNDFWTIRSEPIEGKPLLWEEVSRRTATKA